MTASLHHFWSLCVFTCPLGATKSVCDSDRKWKLINKHVERGITSCCMSNAFPNDPLTSFFFLLLSSLRKWAADKRVWCLIAPMLCSPSGRPLIAQCLCVHMWVCIWRAVGLLWGPRTHTCLCRQHPFPECLHSRPLNIVHVSDDFRLGETCTQTALQSS